MLTSICVYPSGTNRQCFDTICGQFNAVFSHHHVHSGFGNGISHELRKTSDASELDISTLARNECNLLLCAFTNDVEEGVDNIDVADHIVFDLCLVSFVLIDQAFGEGSYAFTNLILQLGILAMAVQCQQMDLIQRDD